MSNIPAVPAPILTPEEFVQQMRSLAARVPDFLVMSSSETQTLAPSATVSDAFLHAAINALAAAPELGDALGRDAETLRQEVELSARWLQAIDELAKLRMGVVGSIRIRRHRVGATALRVYQISRQLVRYKENAGLLPHIDAMKRASKQARRRLTPEALAAKVAKAAEKADAKQ
jgi:hypothetical protein